MMQFSHRRLGDLVIAVGEDGLLIRSSQGEYRTVRVDEILYAE